MPAAPTYLTEVPEQVHIDPTEGRIPGVSGRAKVLLHPSVELGSHHGHLINDKRAHRAGFGAHLLRHTAMVECIWAEMARAPDGA